MFYIKLETDQDDLNLVITQRETIYRGDNLNQKIRYLIPLTVGDIDMLTAALYLTYIRADGTPDVVPLERLEEKYNESYYEYVLPVTCKLSRYAGEVCTWMQIMTGSTANPTISKTGECILRIEASKNLDEYVEDETIAAIYKLQKQMETGFDEMEQSIAEVEAIASAKADNIVFNSEDSTIQLTANGEPIGDKIVVSATSGKLIEDMQITVDGELLVFFDDGSIKNLGKVVGNDGMVYVPHIDAHNVLTFTLEQNPTKIPDPTDLNPDDEWSGMGDDPVETDYVWEPME